MGVLELLYEEDLHYQEMSSYLDFEEGYWKNEDVWYGCDIAFQKAEIKEKSKVANWTIADFTSFQNDCLKTEMKYYVLSSLKNERMTTAGFTKNYLRAIRLLGDTMSQQGIETFRDVCADSSELSKYELTKTEIGAYKILKNRVVYCIRDLYDERPELERDIWHAQLIPGVKLSAAIKREKPSMSFEKIPDCYKASVKRYMKSLIYRRSWSFCTELLVYIRYFYKNFYNYDYKDGFQEKLTRIDIEKYLGWVAEDYEHNNATFRSKAVSFIRNWLDFIQLAEFDEAPKKDITRLIFDEDIPKRERPSDTLQKIKYIPEPVRNELDATIDEIEPAEMKPVYILLRETGWRGTDILNLRYNQCLDYVWNSRDEKYVPYLYDEITKTGIPLHKIPIRPEVAAMVRKLIEEVEEKSTDDNNPDKYLFNTYEGRSKGLPYSKPEFASSVQALIKKKRILSGDGEIHHFKTHSLRHTRAMEYTEQGMPIGVISQILGHCSLQMTLHYSKVSEDMLYKKWKETEKLDLFKIATSPLNTKYQEKEAVNYELVRKNLDAVRVPFGVCFKPSKIGCKTQTRMCLECSNFCSTKDDLPIYEEEIKHVKEQISIGIKLKRTDWIVRNQEYLVLLENMSNRILQEGLIHKNGKLRED
jgi:integrase